MADKIKVGVSKGTNGAAPAKSAKVPAKKAAVKEPEGVFGRRKVVLSVARMPKEGEAPPQAIAVLGILKGLGKASPDELVAALKGKVQSKQGPRAVLNLYRAKLAAQGFLRLSPAEA
jgi:hypothetical protein